MVRDLIAQAKAFWNTPTEPLVGVLAEFAGPDELIEACDHAREAGYKQMDAYTPFPVHGIDDAIGIERTKLPFIVLSVGLFGCVAGLGLQIYCNATEQVGPMFSGYKFLISGKPFYSLPAFIPVTFEVIVLLSAFAAFFGMLILNRLPRFSNPLFSNERFRRVTNDGFFLMIETGDASFDESGTTESLTQWGALQVERVERELSGYQLPKAFSIAGVLIFTLMFVPPAVIFKALGTKSHEPRMHVNPDMDRQFKYRAQTASPQIAGDFFIDGRAMRPDVEGSVARGELYASSEIYKGFNEAAEGVAQVSPTSSHFVSTQDPAKDEESKEHGDDHGDDKAPAEATGEPKWVTEFPIPVNKKMIQRGQQRFNIYCSVCHGYEGDGNGAVAKRATELSLIGKSAWIPPKSFYDPKVVEQPIGRIFDTISNGRGGMGPYSSQITVEDRWAIVLYLKALQATREATESDLPEGGDVLDVDSIGPKIEAAPEDEKAAEKPKE